MALLISKYVFLLFVAPSLHYVSFLRFLAFNGTLKLTNMLKDRRTRFSLLLFFFDPLHRMGDAADFHRDLAHHATSALPYSKCGLPHRCCVRPHKVEVKQDGPILFRVGGGDERRGLLQVGGGEVDVADVKPCQAGVVKEGVSLHGRGGRAIRKADEEEELRCRLPDLCLHGERRGAPGQAKVVDLDLEANLSIPFWY